MNDGCLATRAATTTPPRHLSRVYVPVRKCAYIFSYQLIFTSAPFQPL